MLHESDIAVCPATIRPVELADASALNTLCWFDRSLGLVTEMLQRVDKLTQNRRGLGVVALWDDVPCAFGLLTLWPRAAEISDLVVSADLRGRGIGSGVIQYLTATARNLGVRSLEIGAALSNPRALALYRRLGFVDSRTIELDLGQGPEPVVYLVKRLLSG